jgi:hypothetical protein
MAPKKTVKFIEGDDPKEKTPGRTRSQGRKLNCNKPVGEQEGTEKEIVPNKSPTVRIKENTKKRQKESTASGEEFVPKSPKDDGLDAKELEAECNKPEQIVRKQRKTCDEKVKPVRTKTMKPLARDKDHVPHSAEKQFKASLNIDFPFDVAKALQDLNDMSNRLQELESRTETWQKEIRMWLNKILVQVLVHDEHSDPEE